MELGRPPLAGHKRDGEGQDAHPTQVHQYNQDALGDAGQLRRDAGGEAHGAHGGGHLVGAVQVGQALHRGDHHGGDQKHKENHQGQGHGVEHLAEGDGPAPEGDLLPAPQVGPQSQQQHRHRGGLDAAGGGAGGAADEHQDGGHGLAALAQPPLADGVKAGGAEGHRLEQGVEGLFPHGHVPQGGRVVVLLQEEKGRAAHNQEAGNEQHHLAVHRQPAPAAGPQDVLPDKEAQAADGDQRGGGTQHDGAVLIARQAGEGPEAPPQQVKARVAEGGDRVEHRPPQPAGQAEVGHQPERHEHRPRPLQQEGAHQGVAHHPHHPVHAVQVEGGHHDKPLGQADAPVKGKGDEAHHRHEAQPPQLDHCQDHHLPKQRPLRPGVHQDQPGDAAGGGGGEQSGKKAGALPVPGGDGQGEQQGAHQNDDGEGGRHNPGGVEAPAPDKPVPQPAGTSFQHGEILLCEGKNKLTQKSMPKKGVSFGMLLRI